MTVTIDLTPDEEQRLSERAARQGQDVTAYVRRLIREDLTSAPAPGRRTIAEVLAPVHEDFRASGMDDGELDTLLRETLAEVRSERRPGTGRP
jgi:hypothetical protein